MCCRIFGDGFTAHGTIEEESKFKPITAPVLRKVVLNCDNYSVHGRHSHVGDTFSEMPYGMCQGALQSRIALATCLRLLVSRGAFPMCRKLYLLDMQLHNNDDRTVFDAYNQRDVLNTITCSLPFRYIDPHRSRTCMVRIPGDVEVLGPSWEIAVVAEGRLWVTGNGSRFPAEVRGARRKIVVPFIIGQEFGFFYGNGEDELGRTLLRATSREGIINSPPLKLKLPAGWRISEEDGTTVVMSQT